MGLMDHFDEMDRNTEPTTRDISVRALFSYPGGKSRSILKICKHLPYRDCYISVFGGSGVDILARHPSKLEVFNDRFAGVVAFYRCLRDKEKCERLMDWLSLTVHSREDFIWCKASWKDCTDDVERAARWYYMVQYSFGSLGRNFGRATNAKARIAGKILNKIPKFKAVHERFKDVQIENMDWRRLIEDYDRPEAVFYLDPPYVDASKGIYEYEMSHNEHMELLNVVKNMRGFAAVSGFPNPLYDKQDFWDDVISWKVYSSMDSCAFTANNFKEDHESIGSKRGSVTERLWIKEAR